MVPVVLELELDNYDAAFADTGNLWECIRQTLLADVCIMDMAVQHLLDGKSLPYNFHRRCSLKATVTDAPESSLAVNRGFTRLGTV